MAAVTAPVVLWAGELGRALSQARAPHRAKTAVDLGVAHLGQEARQVPITRRAKSDVWQLHSAVKAHALNATAVVADFARGPSSHVATEVQGSMSKAALRSSVASLLGPGARRRLLCTTAAHVLLNFGIGGAQAIPGSVLPALEQQAGDEGAAAALLVASALGNIVGVAIGGPLMERLPAHALFCATVGLLATALGLMPMANSLLTVALANAAIYLAVGVVDCSYSALVWSAGECGVSCTGPYLAAKSTGTMVGSLTATLVASTTAHVGAGQDSYSVLAYAWCSVCVLGGAAILATPSPKPPSQAMAARECSQASISVSLRWRERAVVFLGLVLVMLLTGAQCTATTLLADYVGAATAQHVLMCYYASCLLALLGAMGLTASMPAAAALVLFFILSGLGALSVAFAFVGGTTRMGALWAGYSLLGTLTPLFSVLFAFVASLVPLSGYRTAAISGGAALGPLIAAAGSRMHPTILWLGFSGLLLFSLAGVVVLEVGSASWLQKGGQEDADEVLDKV